MNRRSFFRDGLFEILRPLSKPIERRIAPFERLAEEFKKFDQMGTPPAKLDEPARSYAQTNTVPLPVLRPPGALPEEQFTNTCSKCGHCVSVCPASAIQLDAAALTGGGYPFIDAEVQPCVICDSLACMRECPSGALAYIPRWLIDMGTAEWNPDQCTRVHGDYCTTCVDQCPLGSDAIELRGNEIYVKESGCSGCGVCQYYCPTYPKSIVIKPKAAKKAELK